ncbi:MAG TPA: LysR family transcriptional regulator [Alphaproteobacteria bacterium]|jgi:DNA-binding transcriptional LysR family regulator
MKPEALDLKKLRAFQLVAEHGSLRRAALRLNLTVSAVSFSIQRLEKDLGVRLFRRLPNKLILTTEGENFCGEIGAVFNGIEKALGSLSAQASPKGRLSLSISSDLAWYFVPRIGKFMRDFPAVELTNHIYKSADALPLVSKGDLDIAVGRFPELEPEQRRSGRIPKTLEKDLVTQTGFSLVCPAGHPLLRNKRPLLEDIGRYQLVLISRQFTVRKMMDAVFSQAGVNTRNCIEASSCQNVCEFVGRGIGVGVIHTLCTEHGPKEGLRFIDITPHFGKITFSAVYRKTGAAASPAVLGMLEILTNRDLT